MIKYKSQYMEEEEKKKKKKNPLIGDMLGGGWRDKKAKDLFSFDLKLFRR